MEDNDVLNKDPNTSVGKVECPKVSYNAVEKVKEDVEETFIQAEIDSDSHCRETFLLSPESRKQLEGQQCSEITRIQHASQQEKDDDLERDLGDQEQLIDELGNGLSESEGLPSRSSADHTSRIVIGAESLPSNSPEQPATDLVPSEHIHHSLSVHTLDPGPPPMPSTPEPDPYSLMHHPDSDSSSSVQSAAAAAADVTGIQNSVDSSNSQLGIGCAGTVEFNKVLEPSQMTSRDSRVLAEDKSKNKFDVSMQPVDLSTRLSAMSLVQCSSHSSSEVEADDRHMVEQHRPPLNDDGLYSQSYVGSAATSDYSSQALPEAHAEDDHQQGKQLAIASESKLSLRNPSPCHTVQCSLAPSDIRSELKFFHPPDKIEPLITATTHHNVSQSSLSTSILTSLSSTSVSSNKSVDDKQ